MSSVSPTNQDLSNDTTFSQIKSRVPVPLRALKNMIKLSRKGRSAVRNKIGIKVRVSKIVFLLDRKPLNTFHNSRPGDGLKLI